MCEEAWSTSGRSPPDDQDQSTHCSHSERVRDWSRKARIGHLWNGRGEVWPLKAFIRATWFPDAWDLLQKQMNVRMEIADFPTLRGRALADRMQGEEAFITDEDRVDEEALAGNAHLRLVGTPSAGLDHIDVHAATRLGIVVVYAPGGNADSVAEYAFGLTLAMSKMIPMADAKLRKGMTHKLESYRPLTGVQLKGKTMGVVGVGNIGSRVAMIAKGFGMDVIGFDPGLLPTVLNSFAEPSSLRNCCGYQTLFLSMFR